MKPIKSIPERKGVAFLRKYFEFIELTGFSLVWLFLFLVKKFPIILPDNNTGAFAYQHYIIPLIAAFVVQLVAPIIIKLIKHEKQILPDKKNLLALLYIPFFFVVVFLHFNFKGWMPLVNPNMHDALYARIDQATPFAGWLIKVAAVINVNNSALALYGQLFILMFVFSLMSHATLDRFVNFRKVIVGTSLVMLIGSMSYWIAPAIGPFVFHVPSIAGFYPAQQQMYAMYNNFITTGVPPAGYFTSAPAAMPSLHVANSFYFLLMARKSMKVLFYIFIPFAAYFFIIAVASGWHYFIDLPFGILLAMLCVFIVDRIYVSPAPAAK